MITVSGISKRYGSTAGLTDANLHIERGECFGLVGANGSGRTTLLQIVATLMRPSSGVLTIDGLDAVKHVDRIRPRLAYVAEEPVLSDPLRSVRVGEYFELIHRARSARARRTPDVGMRDVLARAGVAAETALGALSAGMRRRVALAAALSSGADILLLDEPLHWLDSGSRECFLEWLRESRDAGTTLVVALNDERDVAALCQRVAVLDAGRLTSPSRVDPRSAIAAGLRIAGAPGLA
jgi:ABC-2 type transport system ATP-binding protein